MFNFFKERKEIKDAKIAEEKAARMEVIRQQQLEERKKFEERQAQMKRKEEEEKAAALQACKEKWRKVYLDEFERQGVSVPYWFK